MNNLQLLFALGCILLAIGLGLLWAARRLDASNWQIARAPVLPIRLLSPHDDAWITGQIDCETPLTLPHFDKSCLYYSYKIEEERTYTEQNEDGSTETKTKWETIHREKETTSFNLQSDESSIGIAVEKATFRNLTKTGYSFDGWRRKLRHSAEYFPSSGQISAVGFVNDDKTLLTDSDSVPLTVLRKSRDAFLEEAESGERWTRRWAALLLWLGGGLALYATAFLGGFVSAPLSDPMWYRVIATCAGLPLIPLLLVWFWYTYNTLITYRNRTNAAWAQVDVDLRQRYDLIPRLVKVVKGYTQHEEQTLIEVTKLRNNFLNGDTEQQIAQEADATENVQQLIALSEDYPDLKSDELFLKLSDSLVSIEDKIAHGRNFYNDNVMEFNTLIEQFPVVIVARSGGFTHFKAFQTLEFERQSLSVNLYEEPTQPETGAEEHPVPS